MARARRTAPGFRSSRRRPALLLDPCNDEPEQHLVYFEDGTVGSDTPRGRATIDAFGLNRELLVGRRRETCAKVDRELDARGPDLAGYEIASAEEFAGLRRQRLEERLQQSGAAPSGATAVRADEPAVKRAIKRDFEAHQHEVEESSVDDGAAREGYFAHARLVDRVEIRNFRVIEELTLHLRPPSPSADAPWAMLLGENGLGKSTVLQAITLALLDPPSRDRLGLDASSFVRHGAAEASVSVTLTGATTPIELVARAGSPTFEGNSTQKVLVLGYGATRLLPTAAHPSPATPGAYARVENLFDPFVPVGDTTSWLLGLPPERFDEVAAALRQLLLLEEGELLLRNPGAGAVEVERDGDRVRLEELSAGYQSVIALATDVVKVLLSLWDTVPAAEAIVIVDELGAHLHPRWRMRIVSSLRSVFPRVQFLVSTHDPLCLRGVRDGEAIVLRKSSEGRIVLLDDLPSTDGMRVDQLLASEHFGMGSTIDPEVDVLFAEYYRLKAKRDPSETEQARIAELRDQLDGRKLLGVTRRERLALDAADDFLAHETDAAEEGKRVDLQDATRKKIAALWAEKA